MEEFKYVGEELHLFKFANNWKTYWTNEILKSVSNIEYLVEIGSGIGSNFNNLSKIGQKYLGIEPDKKLVDVAVREYGNFFECGTVDSLPLGVHPDALVYIDVLEHIQDDWSEIYKASASLRNGGFLIVVVPAHMMLYSDFDRSVGHFKRYSLEDLKKFESDNLRIIKLREIDSIGYLISRIGKYLSISKEVSLLTIKFWDFLIPISKRIDNWKFVKFKRGKSIICIYKKYE